MIDAKYLQVYTLIKLSDDNFSAEKEFFEGLLFEVPDLLNSEECLDKDKVISELRMKYGITFDYQDFGNAYIFGSVADGGGYSVSLHGDEWDNICNVRYLALIVQGYFRKFRSDGFLAVQCAELSRHYDALDSDHYMICITAEKVEMLSLRALAEERRINHELKHK